MHKIINSIFVRLSFCFMCFSWMGLWNTPLDGSKPNSKWYYYLYSYTVIGSILFFLATLTMDLTNPETYSRIMAIVENLSILNGVRNYVLLVIPNTQLIVFCNDLIHRCIWLPQKFSIFTVIKQKSEPCSKN